MTTLFFKCRPRANNLRIQSYKTSFTLQLFSTDASNPIVPVKIYYNTDTQKLDILEENKRKSGIYRWINTLNGKSYIGSSVDISRRLSEYFNYNYLINEKNQGMTICRALLKNGYSNFALEILEYCDETILIEREQFYLDLLKPEYNVLKIAGSTFGFKHSEKTKEKMRNAQIGSKNHTYGTKRLESIRNKISSTMGTPIYVYSLDLKFIQCFSSSIRAGQYFNSHNATIRRYAKSGKIFKKEYILSFERLDSNSHSE